MKIKTLIFVVCTAIAMVACDDSTTTLGSTLTDDMDHLQISSASFYATSRSLLADSVYSRNTVAYLGTVRDPETGDYISSSFTTQFHTLEDYEFPKLDSLVSYSNRGVIEADSVELRMFFDDFYGDSCIAMKLSVSELDHAMPENALYYSNYSPADNGYIREGGLKATRTYAITDMNVERSTRDDTDYTKNIRVSLNNPYTDKDGRVYSNYGSYVMNKYYEHPEYFKNSYNLIHNVVPGFFIESVGGLGSMAYIKLVQLNIYFRYKTLTSKGEQTTITGTTSFAGTEEVLVTTTINNDNKGLSELASDQNCTYLKTPSGIFTELTLPVEDICKGHENDSINTANLTITRLNNNVVTDYSFDIPSTLLMVPKDSLCSFFENKSLPNYKTSFIASFTSTKNTYEFNNISSLIHAMYEARKGGEDSEDWNKVVLVPVSTTYQTYNSTSYLTKIVNDMSFTCTRLLGGPNNPEAIKINVIYSRYQ